MNKQKKFLPLRNIQLLKLSLVFFIGGCGGGHKNPSSSISQNYQWPDVVFPIDAHYTTINAADACYARIVFDTQLTHDETINLYKKEMERLGWQGISEMMCTYHALLLFQKPGSLLTSLIDGNVPTTVTLYRSLTKHHTGDREF